MIKILDEKMLFEAFDYSNEYIRSFDERVYETARAIRKLNDFRFGTLFMIGNTLYSAIALELAILLKEEGKDVSILQCTTITHKKVLNRLSISMDNMIPITLLEKNTMLSGFSQVVESIGQTDMDERILNLIDLINESSYFKISIGLNVGLDINSGLVRGKALVSDLTVSEEYMMPSHLLNDAKDYIKRIVTVNTGVPYHKESYYAYSNDDVKETLKKRKFNTHKGAYGYVGVMGGSYRYSGSIKLSNMAMVQLISGAGVSRVIAPANICDSILPYLLESTLCPVSSSDYGSFRYREDEIDGAIKGLKSLAFGMGVGESYDNEQILRHLITSFEGNLLIDADGLNTLSRMGLSILNEKKGNIVLTPHVKEFSRLCLATTREILENPVEYAKNFTLKYDVVLLLKGTATIVSYKGNVYFIYTGGPSLSKGGSGDILSGIISGMMGYLSPLDACLAGSYVFGLTGDLAMKKYGSYPTLGRDLIELLKEVMKQY